MFPTVRGQKFTFLKGDKNELKGLVVDFFLAKYDDTKYNSLSELMANNPMPGDIYINIVYGGTACIDECTIE